MTIPDLDDVDVLRDLGIRRPTDIVTRDRATKEARARTIYLARRYAGVQWWSRHNAGWHIIARWGHSGLTIDGDPEALGTSHAAVLDAARDDRPSSSMSTARERPATAENHRASTICRT